MSAISIVGIVISVLSLIVAAIVGFSNLRRSNNTDTSRQAAEMTTVIVKLEALNNSIAEVKSDVRNLGTVYQEVREKLIIVEQSAKSAHRRLDGIEGKPNAERRS